MGFAFGLVEKTLARVHLIRDDKRVAFRARLKHLQRLGFPSGINTGTGRAAVYESSHLFLLGIALELLQLGLTPERAIKVISDNMMSIAQSARLAATELRRPEIDNSFASFLRFDPSALGSLSAIDDSYDEASGTMFYGGTGVIRDSIETFSMLWPRVALLNVSLLIGALYSSLLELASEETAADFFGELELWLNTFPEERGHVDDPEA